MSANLMSSFIVGVMDQTKTCLMGQRMPWAHMLLTSNSIITQL